MKVNLTDLIWFSIIMFFTSTTLNAQNSDSPRRTEGVINYELSQTDYNFFREFSDTSKQEKAIELIHQIVGGAFGDFEKLKLWDNFVVHISLGGVHKTIYIKKYVHSSGYVDIEAKNMFGYDSFWGIYISDQSDYLANSIEVSIAETKTQSIYSSFLTSPNTVEFYGRAKVPMEVELGIKLFKFPNISSFSVNFIFVQRDLETYASQTWKRSFSVRRPRRFRYDFGIMIPVTKIKFDPDDEVDEISAILTFSWALTSYYQRVEKDNIGFRNIYWNLISPDIVVGLGYPFDIEERIWDNSLFLGYKWHLPFDFLNVTIGRFYSPDKAQYLAGFTISLIPFAKLLSSS